VESKKLAYVEGIGSIVINTVLFGLKYWIGIMTGSIAIMADAWLLPGIRKCHKIGV